MRILTGGRETSAALLNTDIERILNYGKKGPLEFEAKKTKAITSSKKRDVETSPLVMDGEVSSENEKLYILGFTLDSKGTWSPHVDRITIEVRQRLGAIRRLRRYLDNGTYIACTAFVRPKLEYGNLVYWSAVNTHVDKLNKMQQQAHNMFDRLSISSLEHRRESQQ